VTTVLSRIRRFGLGAAPPSNWPAVGRIASAFAGQMETAKVQSNGYVSQRLPALRHAPATPPRKSSGEFVQRKASSNSLDLEGFSRELDALRELMNRTSSPDHQNRSGSADLGLGEASTQQRRGGLAEADFVLDTLTMAVRLLRRKISARADCVTSLDGRGNGATAADGTDP
jgi:hypothetical protein